MITDTTYDYEKRIRIINDAKDRIRRNLEELEWWKVYERYLCHKILRQLSQIERTEEKVHQQIPIHNLIHGEAECYQ